MGSLCIFQVIYFNVYILEKNSHWKCSVKKFLLKISQNSWENTCARISCSPTLFKKSLWHRCFPLNFVKFVRTLFFTEHLWTTDSDEIKEQIDVPREENFVVWWHIVNNPKGLNTLNPVQDGGGFPLSLLQT